MVDGVRKDLSPFLIDLRDELVGNLSQSFLTKPRLGQKMAMLGKVG
jgi:hypothetical protein